MKSDSQRYTQFANSPHPWETDAVHFLRDKLHDAEPNRIWALFEFIARDGTIGEVGALALTAKGFYLVEIKSRPGRVTGDSSTWTWTLTNDSRRFTDDSPILLANRKCKRLVDLISRQRALQGVQLPLLAQAGIRPSPRHTGHKFDDSTFGDPAARKRSRGLTRPRLRRHRSDEQLMRLQACSGSSLVGLLEHDGTATRSHRTP